MTKKELRQAEKVAKAKSDAAAFNALPPQQRAIWYGVLALIVLGGVLFLRSCFVSNMSTDSVANMTPAQLLAIGDGRARDDTAMAAAFARLDAACPENGIQVADLATNFKKLVADKTGNSFPMIYLMDKLADAQGTAPTNQNCVHTAAYLASVAGS